MVDHRVDDFDAFDLPNLALRQNYNLAAHNIIYLRRQYIAVNYDNEPDPDNILDQVSQEFNPLN